MLALETGLRVSELCLGAGTFGTNWGPIGSDEAESRRIFDAFLEAGEITKQVDVKTITDNLLPDGFDSSQSS